MKKTLIALIVLLMTASSFAADPTGKFGLGLQLRGGLDLASRGSIENSPYFEGQFSRPLGISAFVFRYYMSPGLDAELGFNRFEWATKEGFQEIDLSNMPVSLGLFLRSSVGDDAHTRIGGRLNMDILSSSVKQGAVEISETEITLSIEGAFGVEWFVSQHFSLTPEAQLRLELPNEVTNGDVASLSTAFQLTFTVIP